MVLASLKSSARMAAFPKALSSIAASVGGLAIFLIIASILLLFHPVGSRVRGYFYGVDRSAKVEVAISFANLTTDDHSHDNNIELFSTEPTYKSSSAVPVTTDTLSRVSVHKEAGSKPYTFPSVSSGFPSSNKAKDGPVVRKDSTNAKVNIDIDSAPSYESKDSTLITTTVFPSFPEKANKTPSVDSGCDLYHGNWIYDSVGPLYTNNTCPVLTQMQNCQGNGRPDKEYENWRWKPSQCDLPRFDPKKFLELMRGKTLAFIGDSVARNQMESLLCILWQAEVPKNRGNRRMQRWFFRSTSTMIVRIWSSWLVQPTSEPVDFAPEGVTKLHLDAPDKEVMEFLPGFDVVVFSSGHWFAKQSVYVLNNEIVGGQLWWPDKSRSMRVNNIEAFGISVEAILTAIVSHPNYTGLTIVRSYSPDHYEGGAWNTGGSCTGKVRPLRVGELVENGFTSVMHEKQVTGFNRAVGKVSNKSKLRLMDITDAFEYRHDGHPGPYRSPDPNKITKRGPDGRPPPQDCLHWCMPGPVDTWNELLLEIIRREYEGKASKAPAS